MIGFNRNPMFYIWLAIVNFNVENLNSIQIVRLNENLNGKYDV